MYALHEKQIATKRGSKYEWSNIYELYQINSTLVENCFIDEEFGENEYVKFVTQISNDGTMNQIEFEQDYSNGKCYEDAIKKIQMKKPPFFGFILAYEMHKSKIISKKIKVNMIVREEN